MFTTCSSVTSPNTCSRLLSQQFIHGEAGLTVLFLQVCNAMGRTAADHPLSSFIHFAIESGVQRFNPEAYGGSTCASLAWQHSMSGDGKGTMQRTSCMGEFSL